RKVKATPTNSSNWSIKIKKFVTVRQSNGYSIHDGRGSKTSAFIHTGTGFINARVLAKPLSKVHTSGTSEASTRVGSSEIVPHRAMGSASWPLIKSSLRLANYTICGAVPYDHRWCPHALRPPIAYNFTRLNARSAN